jgi:hypothetical protein
MAAGRTMIRRLIALISLMMCVALSAPCPAFGADRDIPLQMLSMRDRLLRDRSQLLYMRSDLNGRIISMQRMQQDMDKLLASSDLPACQYADLTTAKSKLVGAVNELQRRLDCVEKGLINNNQDLSSVDYSIQRFACLR